MGKDVRRRVKMPRSTVAGFLSELEDKGFLDAAEVGAVGRGRPPKGWKPTGRDGEDVDVLPPVEEMFSLRGGNELAKFPPPQPR
jgi:predicted ArsR family transcriptional regulator